MRGVLIASMLVSGAVSAADIAGVVSLTSQGRPLRAEEAREAVVYFRPAQPVPVQPAEKPAEMGMLRKQFQPRALPVTVGSTVRFPNFDPILHNVFSPAGANRFDLGLYGEGEGAAHAFSQVGLVRVYCNVHQDMVGHILVLDTPYFSRPDGQGRFRLHIEGDEVEGELFVWHERAALWRQRLTGDSDEAIAAVLELNRPRVPAHNNKFGRPYGRQGRSRY
jgi:plastocyanin